MAFNSNLAIEQLQEMYRRGYISILETIARAEARGNSTRYQRALLRDVSGILQDLDRNARTWAEQVIPKAYQGSRQEVLALFERAGVQGPTSLSFARVHREAAEVIAGNLIDNLQDAHQFVGRRVRDAFRQAQLDAVAERLTTGSTLRATKRNLQTIISDRGLGAFRDAAGRVWSLDAYANMSARTVTAEATNLGTMNQLQSFGRDLVQITEHSSPCKICAPLEGRIYSISGRDKRYPKLERAYGGFLQIHANCFPAGVLVTGPALAAHVSRYYEGEIVVLHTSGGKVLPVTPNHPILTPKGWVAAGAFDVGDEVIRYTGAKGQSLDDPDDIQVPTPIEDVTAALRESGNVITRSVPVASEYFHGDGAGSEVCVIRANRLLVNGFDSFLSEAIGKEDLRGIDMESSFLAGFGSLATLVKRTLAAASNFVSGGGLGFQFFGRHACNSLAHRFASVGGGGVSGLSQTQADRHRSNAEMMGEGLFGPSALIHADDLINREVFAEVSPARGPDSGTNLTQLDTGFSTSLFDAGDRDANDFRHLFDRLSGLVELDYIVNRERRHFRGHVYNLQTREGWYAANSIITQNCQHRATPYIEELADDPAGDRARSNRSFDTDPRGDAQRRAYQRGQEQNKLRRERRKLEQASTVAPDDEKEGIRERLREVRSKQRTLGVEERQFIDSATQTG